MRTPTAKRVAVALLTLMLLGGGHAQNPFQGFPPAQTSEPPEGGPPPLVPGAPTLPKPDMPTFAPLEQAIQPPTPDLGPLPDGRFTMPLPTIQPSEADPLAWIAHLAHPRPLPKYEPPLEETAQLLAITAGQPPHAAIRWNDATHVLKPGQPLPSGDVLTSIDRNTVTLTHNDGNTTTLTLERKAAP